MAKEKELTRPPGGRWLHRHRRWPEDVFEEFERAMERAFPWSWGPGPWARRGWGHRVPFGERVPAVDVIEREKDIVFRAEVPGVDKDDLDVSLSDDAITIRGKTKREAEAEEGEYHCCEMSYGSFARTVPLPAAVDADRAEATFKDGILEIVVPKAEAARRRTVPIKPG